MKQKSTRIERLLKQQDQLLDQVQEGKNKILEEKRKLDTRKKILIGASILAHVKKSKFKQSDLKNILDQEIKNEKDRKIFIKRKSTKLELLLKKKRN